jgi:hypothetical protein
VVLDVSSESVLMGNGRLPHIVEKICAYMFKTSTGYVSTPNVIFDVHI